MIDISSAISLLFYGYLFIVIILLLLDNRDSSSTIAWVFIFILLPVVGLLFYLLFGLNWRKTKHRNLKQQMLERHLEKIREPLVSNQEKEMKTLLTGDKMPYRRKLLALLYNNSNSILTSRNDVTLIDSGKEKFRLLINDLKQARHSIHMEYFIWKDDALTRSIASILANKAKQGVEVRILYDAWGSFWLSSQYIKQLRHAGVAIYPYFKFLSPLSFHTLNYRNHRKITVIDGCIGYTGGVNMAAEYVDGAKRFPFWRDLHMRITGDAVYVLQEIFINSWYNTTKQDLLTVKYFPAHSNRITTRTALQITTSGPDSQWESIKQLYFTLISSADKRVYIHTPYFVPDPSVYFALKTAALGGVDVRIIITGLPDKRIPYWAAFTYFRDLLTAGVKIYHYQKGFMHAKSITVDGVLCSIGTANMDMRSFHINYELNALLYNKRLSRQLEELFLKDLEHCTQMTIEQYRQISVLVRLRNSFMRLFAPLL